MRRLLRASRLRSRETDGYVYNAYLDEDEGGIDEFGGRVTLVWEPSDSFSANLKYTYMERDRDGANSATWRFLSPAEQINRSLTAVLLRILLMPSWTCSSRTSQLLQGGTSPLTKTTTMVEVRKTVSALACDRDSSEDEVENISLSLTWELGGGTLTSVTGFAGL